MFVLRRDFITLLTVSFVLYSEDIFILRFEGEDNILYKIYRIGCMPVMLLNYGWQFYNIKLI